MTFSVFAFSGEGAHAADIDLSVLRQTDAFAVADAAFKTLGTDSPDLLDFLTVNLGNHAAPASPLVTTVLNILNADVWKSVGFKPSYAVGHSVGELAAAYTAGLITMQEALRSAYELGQVAKEKQGGMVQTTMSHAEVQELLTSPPASGLRLAAINHRVPSVGASSVGALLSVSLCGSAENVEAWLAKDPAATKLRPQHPWHHPDYAHSAALKMFVDGAAQTSDKSKSECKFVSATTNNSSSIDWTAWATACVDFSGVLDFIASDMLSINPEAEAYVIEMGPHPVLTGAQENLKSAGVKIVAQVASLRRGEPAAAFLRTQRAVLASAGLLQDALSLAIKEARLEFDLGPKQGTLLLADHMDKPFVEIGISSPQLPRLASLLKPFFLSIGPQDFYRFSSLAELVGRWYLAGVQGVSPAIVNSPARKALEIVGIGLHLPPNIRTTNAAWRAIVSGSVAISTPSAGPFKNLPAGYLNPPFDRDAALKVANASNIVGTLATALDPQHLFAIGLAEEMMLDAGPELRAAALASKERVGVYIGAWQPNIDAPRSAYRALGTSLSALAAQVANVYDFQGPAVTVNTACSSALGAIDCALRDARAGRIDYAIVGGVNLINGGGGAGGRSNVGSAEVFQDLKRAGMLSPTGRCHTFSAAADGYVRAEGGALYLVRVADADALQGGECRARVIGSAINQNSTRKPITAVDPVAQERCVRAACADAGCDPSELACVEMHGTGTRLGDPVEISALAQVTGTSNGPTCALTASKMLFGHLESAAGAVGILKAVLMLERQVVPRFELSAPGLNPHLAGVLEDSHLVVPTEADVMLNDDALVGVSSFGFAGNNVHVVVASPPVGRKMEIEPEDGEQELLASLSAGEPIMAVASPNDAFVPEPAPPQATSKIVETVWAACVRIIGDDAGPVPPLDAQLLDYGLDSLGLADLVVQLDAIFGDDSVPIDELMADPTLKMITTSLAKRGNIQLPASAPVSTAAGAAVSQAPTLAGPSMSSSKMVETVWAACVRIIGDDAGPVPPLDAQLLDYGLDSLGLADLVVQLDATFGDDSVPIDELMAEPTLKMIIASLTKRGAQVNAVVAGSVAPPPPPSTGPSSATNYGSTATSAGAAEEYARLAAGSTRATHLPVSSETALGAPADKQWIRTTHVGSLPRDLGDGAGISALPPTAVLTKQLEIGLSVINDGEWPRENYISELVSRIEGVSGKTDHLGCPCKIEMPIAADMKDVPLYNKRFTGGNGLITLNPARPAKSDLICTEPPKYASDGAKRIASDVAAFVQGLRSVGREPSDGFFSVPSPGTMCLFIRDEFYYGDHEAYVSAMGEALKIEYETIAASGVQIQVDCPDLAMGRHTSFAHVTDAEFRKIAEANVKALNKALANVPVEQIRVHACWGNYAGPHHMDMAAEDVWPIVGKIKTTYILMEAANPRHNADVEAFAQAVRDGHFGRDQVIVPGVIDTTAARIEHPKVVSDRILRFVKAAGHPSRVIAGTDCGFASTAKSVAVTPDLAYRKLESLVAGAQIATKVLLEELSPVPIAAPVLKPTVIRAAVLVAVFETGTEQPVVDDGAYAAPIDFARTLVTELGGVAGSDRAATVDLIEVAKGGDVEALASKAFGELCFAVDAPLVLIGVGKTGAAAAVAADALLKADARVARRPTIVYQLADSVDDAALSWLPAEATASKSYKEDLRPLGDWRRVVGAEELGALAGRLAAEARKTLAIGFDRRALVPVRPSRVPSSVDVCIIGAGLCGMTAASKLVAAGVSVAILEQRRLVGGIWSMYANSTSQVNSSEGGYCLKDLLPEGGVRDNRDHSPAAEVLTDLSALGDSLNEHVYTAVQCVKVLGSAGSYTVIANDLLEPSSGASTNLVAARGVILAINDRVGLPRPLTAPKGGREVFEEAGGVIADGIADSLTGLSWVGKRVVIFGMGAFAIENVRTALESGAEMVTVVARRHGTICPKAIDYLNFVKPWTKDYKHDTANNVKQMRQWRRLYSASGATTPECWPTQVKHEGHTISVSDIWFIGHHLGKLATKLGTIDELGVRDGVTGVTINDGTFLPADVVVGCIGFTRGTYLCESLTGRTEVKYTNYLDEQMMYLADAEIDEGAFNSFFGSSVLEYCKFFSDVYVEGFKRPSELGPSLWGSKVPATPIKLRKWSQYISASLSLINEDAKIADCARTQVVKRAEHFARTMPPESFLEVNRKEWAELHTRLNGGVEVEKKDQLPYFFEDGPKWCEGPIIIE